jgi:hypothetical protein
MRPWVASEPWRGTDPCVEVRFPVEGLQTVTILAFSYEDEQRVRAWLDSRPDLKQLVDWAAEYAEGGVWTIQEILVARVFARELELGTDGGEVAA